MAGLEGARVVITGGTGFLGSHVARELRGAGADVVAPGSADFDLRKRSEIDGLLRTSRPDAVIHLAAIVGGIGANQAEPGRFFYENALMGIETLEACRVAQVPKVVVAGTVCAYPELTSSECCWSRHRPTDNSTAATSCTCCRPTSTGPATVRTSRQVT